jgi:DNA replication and repair protein RecF
MSEMRLNSLRLKNFRSYRQQAFIFDDVTTLIVGDNGAGKTNLMEAIFVLSTGKSFRASLDSQMIFYGEEVGRISGEADANTLEIVLTTGLVGGEKAPRKKHLVNGVTKRQMDFLGNLQSVLFRPEDIGLVLGGPAARREYLDTVLNQVDKDYRRSLISYQKGLRQRNKLLASIREGEAERSQLIFWDKLLIKNGDEVRQKRDQFLEFINAELLQKGLELKLDYEASVISEGRIKQYAQNEVAAAKTLVGPHRDDFLFIRERQGKAKKNLSIFGSRGEQRMAVLAVKLAELEYVSQGHSNTGTQGKPLLLLDDIFSELDHNNRRQIFKLIGKQQTIITTADKHLIPKKILKFGVKIIKL